MSEISTKAGVFETGKKDEFGVAYQGNRLISCTNKSLAEYSVREGTEVICDRAFMNAKDLRGITLPASIKAIGESAFAGCKSLHDINIPEGVTEIRQSTFRDCKSLGCLELPASCIKIDKWAFSDGLETLVCNAPSMQIDKSAFFGCKTLATVMVPEGSAVDYAQTFVNCRLTPDIEEIPAEDTVNNDENNDKIKGETKNETSEIYSQKSEFKAGDNDQWGLVDRSGKWIIKPIFNYVSDFIPIGKDGEYLAHVCEGDEFDDYQQPIGEWYYIRTDGEKISELEDGILLSCFQERKTVSFKLEDATEYEVTAENLNESLSIVVVDEHEKIKIGDESFGVDDFNIIKTKVEIDSNKFLREHEINDGLLYINKTRQSFDIMLSEGDEEFDISKAALEISLIEIPGYQRKGYLNLIYDGLRYSIEAHFSEGSSSGVRLYCDEKQDDEEDWNFGGLIGSSEEDDDEKEPVDETKVTLYFYGEGVRIDVMDKEDDLMDSFMALREDCIYDIELDRGDYHKNLSIEDLGKTLNELDEDDPEYKESYDWGDWPNMYNPEEIFDNVGRLVWIMSKTGAFVNIELEEGEKFDPQKLRLLSSEIVTPDGEFEVYCGALYNGKEYPLEIDIDSENVKGQQDLWIAEE